MWDESWWEGREAGSDDQHHTLVSSPDAEGIFVFDIWRASSTQLEPDAQIGRASLAQGTADGSATALSCDSLRSPEEKVGHVQAKNKTRCTGSPSAPMRILVPAGWGQAAPSCARKPSVSSAAGQPVKEGLQASLEATGDASVQN
ncbi:hypothetical protein PaG_06581 [Moesziomyces aphidis]|uniref:Uncharacterized protein n=1 Tax=Moesziomyces aphidis TaxID=84754 RepID=W3VDN1_MOEAP|nr:hypothetical protein PaG_06581 [Moesziomyces aphidis]